MKNKLLKLIVACMLFVAFQSCTDITDAQKEWLDRGETQYVGKIDSLKIRGGLYRVKMEGFLYWAKTAKRGIVSWGDQQLEFEIDDIRTGTDGGASLTIDNMEEGSHLLTVQLFDDNGNKSIPEISFSQVYGANYKLLQKPKYITAMTASSDGSIHFIFNHSENAINVELKYEVIDGFITKMLPGDIHELTLENYKSGGSIELITKILPERNACDSIDLDVYEQTFPVDIELEKGNFKVSKLPTDTPGDAHGGHVPNMWDGNHGGGYHSLDGEGVPHHLTIDLGVYTTLTRIRLYARSDGWLNWNPTKIQIWGIRSLDDAETTLPSMDSGWEQESLDKGWKQLFDGDLDHQIDNTIDLNEFANIRYIRIRIVEVIAGTGIDVNGNLHEIYIWGGNIVKL